jgi:hypothetical protein
MQVIHQKHIIKNIEVPRTTISIYKKRGKIQCVNNTDIILSSKLNMHFIEKAIDRLAEKKKITDKESFKKEKLAELFKLSTEVDIEIEIEEEEEVEKEIKTPKKNKNNILNEKYEAEVSVKQYDIQLKQQQIELNRLKIEKLSGDLIPTELVRVVFAQHFKNVSTSFHQAADGFISNIVKITGMDRQQMAGLRSELIRIVNESINEGVDESKKNVDQIVGEYSQTRGQGERK